MEKELVQAYTMRITQANRTELVVILYELVLHDLNKAKEQIDFHGQEEYQKVLVHACKCVNELIVTLDFQYEVSYDLMRLYRYVNECITKCKVAPDMKLFESAINTISGLQKAFMEVAKQDRSGPVMKNTEQVYAGLTYSKGSLNESLINQSYDRGFRA